jgi:Transposase DDE domain
MPIIEQVAAAMQDVLMTIAQRLARETGFVQRESKLDGATFVQTLVFTYMADPNATLDTLTQTAAALNVDITAAGLTQRFTPAAATFLQQVVAVAVQRVLAAEPLAIPVLEQFAGVYIEDSTTIVLPEELRDLWHGCGSASEQGQAALKITLRLDLASGLLSGLSLHDGRRHDSAAAHSVASLPKQALYLADLGFFSLQRLQQIADQQAFFLSRLRAGTKLYDAQGQELDLPGWLARQEPTVDVPVLVGKCQQLKARLLAVRVPQEVADQRRRRLISEAKRKGQMVSSERLALADWTIFITNVPVEMLSLAEALIVARARWQIELLFKLWKSHGRIDESRSGKVWRVICDVYAKLLAMVIQHWTWLLSLWDYPDRSLTKAAQTVQKYALQLACGLWSQTRTCETLETIARCLAKGCRMNPRKKHPNTYQLLLALTEVP